MENGHPYKLSIAATNAMTAYSYSLSYLYKTNLKEPWLLGMLIKRAVPGLKKSYTCWLGWLTHYAAGAVWAMIVSRLLRAGVLKPSARHALTLGICSGIVSVIAWHTVLRLNPRPPEINRKLFYRQLVTAHIIYMSTFMAYYRHLESYRETEPAEYKIA